MTRAGARRGEPVETNEKCNKEEHNPLLGAYACACATVEALLPLFGRVAPRLPPSRPSAVSVSVAAMVALRLWLAAL